MTKTFFATVQNKMHFAMLGQTDQAFRESNFICVNPFLSLFVRVRLRLNWNS
jgi:hypothetical protein